ncbi:MAG TPA: M15 family metallopeptidase [Mobilitalea sp.]|nr:M15 family metallopeptidase [Mobilitalea sp.]
MDKTKIFLIACTIFILSLAGVLILGNTHSDKSRPAYNDYGKASASTMPDDEEDIDTYNNDNINSGDYTYIPPDYEYDDNDEDIYEEDDNEMTDIWSPATEIDLDPNSITVFVNKEYNLPKDFVPDNLVIPNIPFDISGYSERKLMRKEAAKAIEKLFAAALKEGYTLYGISGYRSYDRQKEIFLNNLIKKGKTHTLKYSAAPGTSEHQTGLAMDVSSKSVRMKLVTAFANCPEGKWLAEHAHEYGFIIRYPKDREEVTGYAYEPWHIRYVGKQLATYLYTNNLTLDEYYNYVPSEGFDFEKKYADLLNYKPPVTPTPVPEDEPEDDLTDDLTDDIPADIPEDGFEDIPVDLPEDLPTDLPDKTEGNDNTQTGNSNDDFEGNPEDQSDEFNEPDSALDNMGSNQNNSGNISDLTPTPVPFDIWGGQVSDLDIVN